ncbi:MAG: MG2 domain-containing protein [Myxococcota bacterium]
MNIDLGGCMPSIRSGLTAIVLTGVVVSGCHCGEGLSVLQASPQGALDADPTSIEIVFSRPLVDPDAEASARQELNASITTEPELDGIVQMPTPSALSYRFLRPPPPATRIEVSVAAGLRSYDGQAVLKKDHRFSFTTPRNGLAEIGTLAPVRGTDAAERTTIPDVADERRINLPLDRRVLIELRFPAEIEELKRLVRVQGVAMVGGAKRELSYRLQFPDGDSTAVDRFVIAPESRWPMHTHLDVEMAPGLHVAEKNAGPLANDEVERLRVSTYGPLDVETGPECTLCTPPRTLSFAFSTPVSCADVVERVLVRPAVKKLRCAGQPESTRVRIEPTPRLKGFTDYSITLQEGITDAFGQELAGAKTFSLKTGSATPSFAHQLMFNVLERKLGASHEEKVYTATKLRVRGQQLGFRDAWSVIRKQQLNDQIAWTELPWWISEPEYFEYYGANCVWDDELGEEVCQGTARYPGHVDDETELSDAIVTTLDIEQNRNPWSVVQVPLEPYLGQRGGLVVLEHTPFDSEGQQLSNPVLRLLNVTDIGLTAKYSTRQILIMAAGLSDGAPIPDAEVTLYRADGKNQQLDPKPVKATTDAEGIATIDASAFQTEGEVSDLQSQPLFIVATKNNDEAFMWSKFESGGRRAGSRADALVGAIYTERGVYRPGETVFFRAVVREPDATGFSTPSGEANVRATLRSPDSYGDEGEGEERLFDETLVVSEFGTVHGSFVVPKSARIGTYSIAIGLEGESNQVFDTFKVAEFRRAELSVTINTDRSEYIRGDTLRARVNSDYLFGAPAAGLDLRWSLRRSWGEYRSKRFQDAVFADTERPYSYEENSAYTSFLDEGQSQLDDKGTYAFERRLDGSTSRGRLENLVLSATVDDESGQSVTSRRTVVVHPASVHVGLITKGYIKESGRRFTFEAVAVNTDDSPASGVDITIGSQQSRWYSVRRKGPGGRMYWDYKQETFEDDEVCQGTTNADGKITCQLKPKRGGSLRLIASAKDKQGRDVKASGWYWVVGDPSYYGGRSDGQNQVSVFSEKPEVEVGETARIGFSSPFKESRALITVEREDILWRKVVDIGTNGVVDIPIEPSWAPNVFVSATLVRGRVTPEGDLAPDPERDKPAYAIGYTKLKVRPTRHILELSVETDRSEYEPGEVVTASLNTADFRGNAVVAEVNLYAVDEGVLSLTGYRLPDPVSRVFVERPYGVLALDTRMHVLGRRDYVTPVIKGEGQGGGGGAGAAGEKLRDDFNPVATWVGAIQTNNKGRAIHTFELPDTLTRYRLMAVAVTRDDRFGAAEANFNVNKTLMMRQALSRFARPGDRIQGGVIVNQLSGKADTVEVLLESIDERLFKVRGERVQRRRVGDQETIAFRFDIEALDAEGTSEVIFAASMGEYRDRVQLNLPVQRLQPRESVSVAGVLPPGEVNHRLKLPAQARAVSFDFNASALPVANLEAKVRGLVGYPYGCLEQRTSKIMPLVAVQKLSETLNFASIPTETIEGWVSDWLERVPRYRCGDDGFDYYPGCANGSDAYLTAFVLDGLLTVRRFGYAVPDALIDPAASYLDGQLRAMKSRAERSSRSYDVARLASALRTLSELGKKRPALENRLYEGRSRLPLFAQTDLVRAMHSRANKETAEVRTVLADIESRAVRSKGAIRFAADDPEEYWWAWDSETRATALVLRTLLQIRPSDDAIPLIVRGLVELDNETTFYATQGLTQTLIGLAEAAEVLKNEGRKPTLTVSFAEQELATGKSVGQAMERISVPGDRIEGTGPFELAVSNGGSGPLYFGGFFSYAYPAAARLPARASGLELKRRYLDRAGNPIGGEVRVGDYVMVELELEVDETGSMVVIDDPLPAGLEPVDTTFETSDTEMARVMESAAGNDRSWWQSRYRELRDDRVEWHFRQVWKTSPDYPITLRYLTRATTAGSYYAPGTRAERMYQPHIRGRSRGRELQVLPKP